MAEVSKGRISTVRFAELLSDYEQAGRNLRTFQKRLELFSDTATKPVLPNEIGTLEEYRNRTIEVGEIERGRTEQCDKVRKDLEDAHTQQLQILQTMRDEGVYEGV